MANKDLLHILLEEAKNRGFNKIERHEIGILYRNEKNKAEKYIGIDPIETAYNIAHNYIINKGKK